MLTRYLLHMLALAGLHIFAFSAFLTITGQLEKIVIAIPANLTILVAINLIGATVIFRPIQKYLAGAVDLATAVRRIHRLPRYSVVWATGLVFSMMTFVFFGLGVLCPGCDAALMAPFYVSMIILFCTFAGILIFFLIDDFTAQLKTEIFRRSGDLIPPTGARLRRKLIAAFIAIGVVPVALVVLEPLAFTEARRLQGITTGQAFLFDIILILIMAAASFFFIQRNLTRPVASLLASMGRVGGGDFETKTPIITDDEIGSLAMSFNQMIEEVRVRERIKETFGKYVPKSVAQAIFENDGEIKPEHRLATILFTDIEGFTAITETIGADEVVRLLNEYFSLIVAVIREHGGVVNQFQGDALLVTFNVPVADPGHARAAVQTAIEIQQALDSHVFDGGHRLVTRIGVNTGKVVAGPVGADDRVNYTVHGDAVNTAARLEHLNKEFGTRILVSDETRRLAGDGFDFKQIGDLPIRGKNQSVNVFEVGHRGETGIPARDG